MSAYTDRMCWPRWAVAAIGTAIVAAGLIGLAGNAVSNSQDSETQRAKTAIEEAIKKDPANSELWLHLGFIEKKLGNVEASQTAFEKCVSLNPKNADAYYMLGLIYEKKKMKDQAIGAWKSCLANTTEERVKEIARKHLSHLQQEK
jgi:cytochrome c-type biogenesis protein CcmH/NrfG